MTAPRPVRHQGGGYDTGRTNDSIGDWANDLINKVPILDGVLLENVALTTSAANVNHTLGRNWRGYFVVKRNANAVVYDDDTPHNRLLVLTASAAVTVDLWVF